MVVMGKGGDGEDDDLFAKGVKRVFSKLSKWMGEKMGEEGRGKGRGEGRTGGEEAGKIRGWGRMNFEKE